MSTFLPEPQDTQLPASVSTAFDPDLEAANRLFAAAATRPLQIVDKLMPYIQEWLQVANFNTPISQVIGAKTLLGIQGIIPASGTTPTDGSGFTYTHTGASGVYVFTFEESFQSTPIVLITPLTADTTFAVPTSSVTGFTVSITDHTNVMKDAAFNFFALPVSS